MVRAVFNSFVILLTCVGVLEGLPVGNPVDGFLYQYGACTKATRSDPCVVAFNYSDIMRMKVGFYGDYVYNRHMETNSRRVKVSEIQDFALKTNAGYLALNVFDVADIFGIVGVTNIALQTNESSYSNGQTMIKLDFTPTVSWGVGTRLTLWKYGNYLLGVEGEYFRTVPDLNSIVRIASGDINYFNEERRAPYSEWQVGLGGSYLLETAWMTAAPYIALKRAGAQMLFHDRTFNFNNVSYTLRDVQSKKMWGYAVGISMVMQKMIGVTIEGRFADEKACFVNAQLRY